MSSVGGIELGIMNASVAGQEGMKRVPSLVSSDQLYLNLSTVRFPGARQSPTQGRASSSSAPSFWTGMRSAFCTPSHRVQVLAM